MIDSVFSRRNLLVGAGATALVSVTATAGHATPKPPKPGQRGALPTSMPRALQRAHRWRQSFVTDFTTSTSLDTAAWSQGWFAPSETAISGPVNGNERSVYDPANISFSADGISFQITNTPAPGSSQPHTSAIITSWNKTSLTPGTFVEARLKMPGENGMIKDWPGFWINGLDGARMWPQYGEIDIIEGLDGQAAWHYHWGEEAGVDIYAPGRSVPGDFTGWHTFAVHWEPDQLDFYYDGILVGTVTDHVESDPHYMILGHSTNNPGPVEDSVLTCSHVQAFQHH